MRNTRTKTNNERALEQIRAFKYFDEHQITREGPGLWYCGKPGTGIQHFRVIMVPGRIIVTGDLGDMILCVNHRKPLRWARGARFKPDQTYYPMSKLSHHCRNKEFKVEEATEWLEDQVREYRRHGDRTQVGYYIKILREWKECTVLDHPREAEREWYEILYRHDYDEPPGFSDHDIGTYYRYQALCWFMTHVDPNDPRFEEELKP